MFLLDSGKFAADPDGTANEVLGILEKAGATIIANRPWADGKLAYPIKGQRRALHYLTYFRMPGSGVGEITHSCKLSETVLRHMVVKHPQSLFDAMVAALSAHETAISDAAVLASAVEVTEEIEEIVESEDDEE
jgi:small subunit ribosomal protein S6